MSFNDQYALEKYRRLYERWQESTSTSYSEDMFILWIDEKIDELEKEEKDA